MMTRVRALAGPMSRGGAVVCLVLGLLCVIAAGFGIVDIARHSRSDAGAGVAFHRYASQVPTGPNTYTEQKRVHLRVYGAQGVVSANSSELYDLIGPGGQQLPVELEEDTFSHDISRARYAGQWYVLADPGGVALIVVLPALLLGLVLVGLSVPTLARASRAVMTGRTPRRRWLLLVTGVLIAVVAATVSAVFSFARFYDVGSGEVYGHYGTLDSSFGLREWAHVHVDGDGATTTADSSSLYALGGPQNARVPVNVDEDAAGKISRVRYQGRAYDVGASKLLALVVTIPMMLLGLALALLNGLAILQSRRAS